MSPISLSAATLSGGPPAGGHQRRLVCTSTGVDGTGRIPKGPVARTFGFLLEDDIIMDSDGECQHAGVIATRFGVSERFSRLFGIGNSYRRVIYRTDEQSRRSGMVLIDLSAESGTLTVFRPLTQQQSVLVLGLLMSTSIQLQS